jgi:phage terminase large subunit
MMAAQVVDFPEKFQFLFKPMRYKVAYGGRGGAKSWAFARALLLMAAQKKMLIVCAREIQNSIRDSVHRLLESQIQQMGLQGFYEVTKEVIRGANGSEFIFKGLWNNVDNIKSLEGADVVWIEEANLTSEGTWEKLKPTVRKEGSEIWLSFNPELEEDYLHEVFVVGAPPANSHVVKVGWQDNPWFPSVLRDEMLEMRTKDAAKHAHIWEGHCKQVVDGAIFAGELQSAHDDNRITRVPVQAGVPVSTYWDLGYSDNTAIWFVQMVGFEYRVIDFYQANAQKMPHYVDVLARRGYLYGDHHLPHDAEHEQLAASESIKQQLQSALRDNKALGKQVRIVERTPSKAQAIDSARRVFERCVFDKERCKEGLQCLKRYRYKTDEKTGRTSKDPTHDKWSHGADAFLQMAQYAQPTRKPMKQKVDTQWMV